MPLYEYQCKKCKEKFETLISIKDAQSPVECPQCGSKETDRFLSTFCASVSNSRSSDSCCDTSKST